MEVKELLKAIENEMKKDDELFGDSFGLVFQSYSTYAIAVRLTEEFYRLTNLMSTESEELTEEKIAEQLKDIIKICVKSIQCLDVETEESEEEEQQEEERTIGFAVADKEKKEKTKRDKEKDSYKYPIDTYATSYSELNEWDLYPSEYGMEE